MHYPAKIDKKNLGSNGEDLKYKLIVDAISEGIIIRDKNATMLEANPTAYRMHGYTYEEFLKLSPADLVHQDYRFKVNEFMQSIEDDKPFYTQTQNLRKDGSFFPAEITAVSMLYFGEKCKLVVIKDITERQKAEEYEKRKEQTENIISYFSNSLSGRNSIEEALLDIVKNCIPKLGFVNCVIYLKDETGKKLIQKAAYGRKNSNEFELQEPSEILVGSGIVGYVAISGKAEIVDDTSKDKRYLVDDINRLSEIVVPIKENGNVLGIIDSEHPEKGFFTSEHLNILNTLAALCSSRIIKIKAEEEVRKGQVRLNEIEKRVAESKLKALQIQMNPHFIFNSLNSIQHFIIGNDNKLALNYLSKFAKLLRQILENSEHTHVLITNELKILQYYIDLEALRFENKFDYYMEIDKAIDIYTSEIPSMIIQPFVENALLHGLLNKDGKGYIQIKMVKQGNYVVCTIEDNGVGRQEAARIKRTKIVQHKSMAISVTQDRLELLNETYTEKIQINIIDLFDKNNSPRGTRVEISFPIEHD